MYTISLPNDVLTAWNCSVFKPSFETLGLSSETVPFFKNRVFFKALRLIFPSFVSRNSSCFF